MGQAKEFGRLPVSIRRFVRISCSRDHFLRMSAAGPVEKIFQLERGAHAIVEFVINAAAVSAEIDRVGPFAGPNGPDVRSWIVRGKEETIVERKCGVITHASRGLSNHGHHAIADAVRIGLGNLSQVQDGRQEIEMIIERVRLDRFWKKLRIMDDQRNVDHLFINRIGLLAHAVRQPSLAMIGQPNDDGFVREAGFIERVQHFGDVFIGERVEIGVKFTYSCRGGVVASGENFSKLSREALCSLGLVDKSSA